MQKIQDVVDSVFDAMRLRGYCENTLQQRRWSIYAPIINYHRENGTEYCSNELLESICKKQEVRYMQGKIGRKHYRAFVTAAFRIRSYINTGEVDFSIVKDTKKYKPSTEYQEVIDSILMESGLTEGHQYKLGIIMRQFFCFFEKRHNTIREATGKDFLEFIPEAAKTQPNNMNCTIRALRYIVQYLNDHQLAEINVDFNVFRPQSPPNRLIAPFTQDEIAAVLNVIESHSKTPKRDTAIILLAFNSGLRCVDIRNLKLHNIDWNRQELSIVQKKTGASISTPLNGKTLNVIAEYILEERPKSEDAHVFLRGHPPYTAIKTTSPMDYMIDKYCRLASVEKKSYRSFHSLRRAFGTELAIAEVPVTTISQMLGHSDMSTDKAYLSFNKSQTSLCSSDFSEVPITKGVYALYCLGVYREVEKDGEQT